MTTLTVLGGGQLGQMLALAAIPMGVDVRSLDPSAGATAGTVSVLTVGELDDLAAITAAATGSEIVTYEWEGVPAASTRALESDGWIVRPSTAALEISQDRIAEKSLFTSLGIPVAPHSAVITREELDAALLTVGLPAILKTCRGGYDGKGQVTIDEASEADAAWTELAPAGDLVLEGRVPFDRELSIIAVRGTDGDIRTWPLVENHHRNGILRTSFAPAPEVADHLQSTADGYARAILDHFDYVGVLTVELFQVGDRLVANEMAPRVHNSGHWTIEGAVTSQFENHVRAVLGWPLGETTAIGHSAMVNCIGALPEPTTILGLPGVHLHRYGKSLRTGRKVGHVTVTAPDLTTLHQRLDDLRSRLPDDLG